MDPVTQGVVGVCASQLVARRREKLIAAGLGLISGMAADLDVLISSNTDPLLFLEYHRHFTHALVFIPVGALLCAFAARLLFRWWFSRNSLSFARTYLFCFSGYATHALLDACTTYGTQLFWPFSDMRVAWNNVSVVDPLFSLPLLVFMTYAVFWRSHRAGVLGACYALMYLGLGVVQNNRAGLLAYQLAESRGHKPLRLGLKPSFANIVLWKSVYEHEGRYYVDAIRVLRKSKVYQGVNVEKLEVSKHFPWLEKEDQQSADIERFGWFSNQHLGLDPNNPNRIIDVRYSMIPNQVTGMWGVELDENASQNTHVTWSANRPQGAEVGIYTKQLWHMILGQ